MIVCYQYVAKGNIPEGHQPIKFMKPSAFINGIYFDVSMGMYRCRFECVCTWKIKQNKGG